MYHATIAMSLRQFRDDVPVARTSAAADTSTTIVIALTPATDANAPTTRNELLLSLIRV